MSPLALVLAFLGYALFFVAPLVTAGDILQRTVEEMRRDGMQVRWWFGVHAICALRSRMASATTREEQEKCRRWWRNMKHSFVLSLAALLYMLSRNE